MLPLSELCAVSPVDGRYAARTAALRHYFSEYALIRERVRVEIAWFLHLADEAAIDGLPGVPDEARERLLRCGREFSVDDGEQVKVLERRTNHDVKAVEYWLADRLRAEPALASHVAYLHFACTSEDINNLAWSSLLQRYRDESLLPALDTAVDSLRGLAHRHADRPMLARTHGQTASPTTLGKEFANVCARLERQRAAISAVSLPGKMNGATGNYNAHLTAYPDADWPTIGARFVESMNLRHNAYTTQIEPHDDFAAFFDALARANVILIDFCRDVWGYISLGYLMQKPVEGEVGSSTMPHKVNPIDFENAEGNLGLANAVLGHLARKLPVSRFQRDLTDSTVLRNLGVGAAYVSISLASLERGLDKLDVNAAALARDLDDAWEVLGEAVQTAMRRHGDAEAYDRLKALTRGRPIDAGLLAEFIGSLDMPIEDRERLRALTPHDYTGLAARLARAI